MFFGILGMRIVDLNVQIFKMLLTFSVLSARRVHDMRHSHFYKLFSLEGRLVGPHHDSRVNLKQVDLTQSNRALYIARTDLHVGETAT